MEETYNRARYVLVVRLPRQVEVRIEDAYLALAGTTKPVMGYHISLLGPFHVPDEADSPFLANIGAVPAGVQRGRDPSTPNLVGGGIGATAQGTPAVFGLNDLLNIFFFLQSRLAVLAGLLISRTGRGCCRKNSICPGRSS